MVDKSGELIRLSPANPKLRVTEYDKTSKRVKVEFDPPVRYTLRDTKITMHNLEFKERNFHAICPARNGNGVVKVGDEYSSDSRRVRGYVDYSLKKITGYELKITRIGDNGDVDVSIKAGKVIREKASTIKAKSVHLTKEQLLRFSPTLKDRGYNQGDSIAVDGKIFERFYSSRNKEKEGEGGIGAIFDDEGTKDELSSSGPGLELKVTAEDMAAIQIEANKK